MQITNTIEIICSKCGKPMPTELSVGREYNPDKWIFKVMPCKSCTPGQAMHSDGEGLCLCEIAPRNKYCPVHGDNIK
jgi:hypothetical protein